MRDKLNEMIAELGEFNNHLKEMQEAINQIQSWIDSFDTSVISEWINEHLMSMFFVEINDNGYFVVYFPEGWQDVTFRTSGWDEVIEPPLDYGHLILHY